MTHEAILMVWFVLNIAIFVMTAITCYGAGYRAGKHDAKKDHPDAG